MPAYAMNHFTILADDLEKTAAFYRELLGFEPGYRPDMGFPGLWLYAGDQALLHVINRNPLPQARRGILDHMAFSARGLAETERKLLGKGVHYELGRQVETAAWQMFFQDPNGAMVELDFAPSEEALAR